MRIIKPASCLSPFIRAFIIVESDEGLINRLLPDTAIVMAFRYKGAVSFVNAANDINLPSVSVSVLRKTSRLVQYSDNSGNILVQFREGAAATFFPIPVHELFESSISLAHLFGQSFMRQLEEMIYLADTIEAKINIIEQFLISRLPSKQPDLLISDAVKQIQITNGLLRIRELAQSLNISHDAFEKRFRKTVGTTPKQFAAIVRMKSLIGNGTLNKPLIESALNAGFFDQSHFIREFRKLQAKPRATFSVYVHQEYNPSLAHNRFQLDIAIAEIAASIAEIEQNTSIYQEKNFDARTETLDYTEFHIIDRLNVIMESADGQDQLIALKNKAETLRNGLEKIDRTLFKKLRKMIRAKAFTGPQFTNLIKAYIDPDLNKTEANEAVGYDNLDIFINGLCQFRALPEQTTALEPEMVYYQKTPARIIFEMVNRIDLTHQDIFVDLGSGLGQVVILFHLLTGIKARGIEFDPAYCSYAIDCAAELNLSQVTFINADARKINYAEGTLFFLFTPFRGEILQEVLSLLQRESLQREIRIITYGPCIIQIAKQDWLYPCNQNNSQSYQLGIFSSFTSHHQ